MRYHIINNFMRNFIYCHVVSWPDVWASLPKDTILAQNCGINIIIVVARFWGIEFYVIKKGCFTCGAFVLFHLREMVSRVKGLFHQLMEPHYCRPWLKWFVGGGGTQCVHMHDQRFSKNLPFEGKNIPKQEMSTVSLPMLPTKQDLGWK